MNDKELGMDTLLELIGNTPLIEVESLHSNPDVRIFAKLEWFNLTGSLKDRIAKYIIEKAEKRGELDHDKIILESTSGNMGISLATIAAIKGYRVMLTMSEVKSVERRKVIKMLGADLILTNGEDPNSNVKKVQELYSHAPDKYFLPNQNENQDNCLAHYETTGKEILDQTNGEIDYFVCGVGTAGTLMGVSRRLKEHNNNIKVISVEPLNPQHILEGLQSMKSDYIPGIYYPDMIDEICYITDDEAVANARRLAQKAGLLVGISSGACMAAAIKKSEQIRRGNIVTIFADGGLKYLSTRLFE